MEEVWTSAHLAAYFGAGDSCFPSLGTPGQGTGEGRGSDCPGPQGAIGEPGGPAPETAAPHSREPPPAVKPVNYSQGLSSPWRAGEGGRKGWFPAPPVGNLIPPREAVGGLGPW